MAENRSLIDTFNISYNRGMALLNDGNYEASRKNILIASEALFNLAKQSKGTEKENLVNRANELFELANKIGKRNNTTNKKAEMGSALVGNGDKVSLEEAMEELNSLEGLTSVKKHIADRNNEIINNERRKKLGLPAIPMTYHLVLTGNPGTGKTTVARIIAKIYCALGILPKGHYVELDRSDIVGKYVGHTEAIIKEKINEARGGVLFIDEAYALNVNDVDGKDFGGRAIDILTSEMENYRDDLVVIVAGYPKEMKEFISSNPGLESRFKTTIHFDDYTGDELYRIYEKLVNKYAFKLTNEARNALKGYLCDPSNHFSGNARDIRKMFETMYTRQSERLTKIKTPQIEELTTIIKEDLPIEETHHSEYEENKTDLSRPDLHFEKMDRKTTSTNTATPYPIDFIKGQSKENASPAYNNPGNSNYDGAMVKEGNNDASKMMTPNKTNPIWAKLNNTFDKNPKEESDEKAEDVVMNNYSGENNEYKFNWDTLPQIGFNDIAGLDYVKHVVREKVILPLKCPDMYEGYLRKNGGGLFLYGPPGTGKTMIGAAIANEIGAKFCSVKPSDLIYQGAGNTEKAVRALFAQARQFPCAVIYFDEMDALAQKNTKSSYARQLRSEFLAQMQGIESYGKETGNTLFLIAATNKPWDVDSAFVRPGRFGTRVYVGLPDDAAREYLIGNRFEKTIEKGRVAIDPAISIDDLVEKTKGFNGSDISNLLDRVDEISALRCFNTLTKKILPEDFDKAFEEIKSSVQPEDIEKLQQWKAIND